MTTISGLLVVLRAIRVTARLDFRVRSLQETHARGRVALVQMPAERISGAREPVALVSNHHSRRVIGART